MLILHYAMMILLRYAAACRRVDFHTLFSRCLRLPLLLRHAIVIYFIFYY